jgi:hypothetical protein
LIEDIKSPCTALVTNKFNKKGKWPEDVSWIRFAMLERERERVESNASDQATSGFYRMNTVWKKETHMPYHLVANSSSYDNKQMICNHSNIKPQYTGNRFLIYLNRRSNYGNG